MAQALGFGAGQRREKIGFSGAPPSAAFEASALASASLVSEEGDRRVGV